MNNDIKYSVETKVQNFIRKNNMIESDDMLIVGVSGGADSICLYNLLISLGYKEKMVVVHIHHGIRGEEADRDFLFVKDMCGKDGVKFVGYHFDVPGFARENKLSEEEAGRILRYEKFDEVLNKYGGKGKIVIAHNKNDVCETFIYNLCRGTGIKGLTGISKNLSGIIRPILCLGRDEIEEYLKSENIEHITDSTNNSEAYTRNKIRHNVLPYLEDEINNNSMKHILMAGEELSLIEDYIEKQTDKYYAETVVAEDDKAKILLEKFIVLDEYIKTRIIRKIFLNLAGRLKDITRIHVYDVLSLENKEVNKFVMLPYSMVAKRKHNEIIVYNVNGSEKDFNQKHKDEHEICDEFRITKEMLESENLFEFNGYKIKLEISKASKEIDELNECILNLKKEQKTYTKIFDYDKIKAALVLRFPKEKDYIIINTSGNKKLIKKYLKEEKTDIEMRNKIPVFYSGDMENEALWVIGYRIGENYKIDDKTKTLLKITVF
ncbi:tRNA(Ile)-lysidine synthase [Lachnospiraceae bacterium RM5]|nr:tRNA(Ile)-lysidine synthase [Lachnospiraceae bacterium RM5]